MTKPLTPEMKAMRCKKEADVKKLVKEVFAYVSARYGNRVWYFMPPANGFGRSGVPDFVGAAFGHAFGVETKFGSNGTTVHQDREIEAMRAAGAMVWIVTEHNFPNWKIAFEGWVALLCS